MKSQDILLLLKLVSLEKQQANEEQYSFRNLEAVTGISKSQVSESLKRSLLVKLAANDRSSGVPVVNKKALLEFVVHGLKYVFPASPGALVRGIPTTYAAPGVSEHLMTAGDSIFVWPDATAKEKGQAIAPLYKSVPKAVKQDPYLYELLALIDSIRTGRPREANLAAQLFEERLFEERLFEPRVLS